MAAERQNSSGQPPEQAEVPLRVFTCGRVGMHANPPRPRLRLLRRR